MAETNASWSTRAPLRVAIVGAGAIGGTVAARLAALPRERVRLSVLARGATLDAIRREGLAFRDAHGARAIRLQASDDPRVLGEHDLVILAAKAPALTALAPQVAALLSPQGRVLVAMNGVPWWFFHGLEGELDGARLACIDPGGVISAALPPARVLGCVVHLSSVNEGPARVHHVMGDGLIVGEPAGPRTAALDAVVLLLREAGFNVTASERIQREIWFKLWGNLTMNPISALTGATCDRMLDDELVRAFASAVMVEANGIGARIGCGIDQTPDDRHAITRKLGAFRTSMLQDMDAGRAIELDAIVTAVREIGQRLAMPTPSIDTLLGLTRLAARTRGVYPG